MEYKRIYNIKGTLAQCQSTTNRVDNDELSTFDSVSDQHLTQLGFVAALEHYPPFCVRQSARRFATVGSNRGIFFHLWLVHECPSSFGIEKLPF